MPSSRDMCERYRYGLGLAFGSSLCYNEGYYEGYDMLIRERVGVRVRETGPADRLEKCTAPGRPCEHASRWAGRVIMRSPVCTRGSGLGLGLVRLLIISMSHAFR